MPTDDLATERDPEAVVDLDPLAGAREIGRVGLDRAPDQRRRGEAPEALGLVERVEEACYLRRMGRPAAGAAEATMWRLTVAGLAALAVLLLGLVSMHRLLPLDILVWTTVLFHRTCSTDALVALIVDAATIALMVELGAAVVIALRTRGLRAAWTPLATIAVGMLASKALKNLFVRERPSMLPGVALGHSFPSGHVMNSTLAALAIVTLTAELRHARRWRAAAFALVAIIACGRVLVARHWLTDAVGGLVAAIAVTGLATRPFARRPVVAPVVTALVLAIALGAVVNRRSLGVTLPSPLSARGGRTVEVDVAFPDDSKAWRRALVITEDEGRTAWVHGSATIEMEVPAAFALHDSGNGGAQLTLALAGRPDISKRCCVTVALELNGHALPPFVAFVGWREYRFTVPSSAVRAGENALRVTVTADDGAPWRFAATYIRLSDT